MASAQISSTRIPFTIFTILAAILLQGILIADGAFFAMLKAIWFGEFANGKPLHRVYTGMPVVDELLAMSVSFWDAVASVMPALRLESIMLCASLQTFAVWATIERMRVGSKHIILRYAPVYIFCWQYFGTAIFVPFYCYTELNQHFNPQQSSDPSVPFLQAKALLPAAVIAFLHPYRMVYFPPSGMTESQHQTFIANYQLGPFICYALVAAFVNYLSSDHREEKQHPANADAPWIKATYAVFGLFSGVVHLSIMRLLLQSNDSSVSFATVFVPQLAKIWKPDAAASLYTEESLFFLQWDFILVVLACSIYSTRIAEGMYGPRDGAGWPGFKSAALVLAFGVACVLLGPGAVVSGVLYLREDFLRRDYRDTQERNEVQAKGLPNGKH